MNQNIIDLLRSEPYDYGWPYPEIWIGILQEQSLIKEPLTDEEFENLCEVIYGV